MIECDNKKCVCDSTCEFFKHCILLHPLLQEHKTAAYKIIQASTDKDKTVVDILQKMQPPKVSGIQTERYYSLKRKGIDLDRWANKNELQKQSEFGKRETEKKRNRLKLNPDSKYENKKLLKEKKTESFTGYKDSKPKAFILHDRNDKCFYCEKPFIEEHYGTNKSQAKTIDHIIPLSKGGINHRSNKVHACAQCNVFKSGMSLQEFLDTLKIRIAKNKWFKGIPVESMPVIQKNVLLLIGYVDKKGTLLLKITEDKMIVKPNIFLDKPVQVKMRSDEEIYFLQSQTVEQFTERKKLNETVKRMLAAPAENFHVD